jgi:hypothetical protein
MGSTEIGVGGLSPPSVALAPNPLANLMTLTPLVVTTPSNPSPPLSTSGSTRDHFHRDRRFGRRGYGSYDYGCGYGYPYYNPYRCYLRG